MGFLRGDESLPQLGLGLIGHSLVTVIPDLDVEACRHFLLPSAHPRRLCSLFLPTVFATILGARLAIICQIVLRLDL